MSKLSLLSTQILLSLLSMGIFSCKNTQTSTTVHEVMDKVVTRLYKQLTPAQLDTISQAYILNFLSEEEKQTLATRYWVFEVDVPVVVSLMRNQAQKHLHFGFKIADLRKRIYKLKMKNTRMRFGKNSLKKVR
ncbi:MAG: hypothetical protein R2822_26075 [Spirosomataceae bacterium]